MKIFAQLALSFLFVLSLCGTPQPAYAQGAPSAPPTEAGGFFSNLEAAAQQLSNKFSNDVLSQISQSGMTFATGFKNPALALAGSLALLYLIYEMLMYLGSKNGSAMTVLFDVGVPAITAALLITYYADHIGRFDELLKLLRNVAGEPSGGVMTFYGSVLDMIGTAVSQSFKNLSTAGFLSIPLNVSLSGVVDVLLTVIFAIVILFIVFSSMAEVLGLLLLGPFLYAIAVAFGPFMLAGLVTPWTREYVGKWVGFLVGSAMVTGVLSLIITLAIKCLETLNFSNFTDGSPTAASLGMVAIMLMGVNSLIAQAPSIASALVPGSIGARTGGGGSVTSGVQKKGAAAGGRAAQAPARAAKAAATAGVRIGWNGVLKLAGKK